MNTVSKEQGRAVRAVIIEMADAPGGFAIKQLKNSQHHCNILMAEGKLYRAHVNALLIRYFVSPEAVAKFLAANPWRSTTREMRNFARQSRAKQIHAQVERKPYTPPKPRCEAVSVDGPNVKRIYRPWVDHRAVSVPFLRVGDAGWSMSVGGRTVQVAA